MSNANPFQQALRKYSPRGLRLLDSPVTLLVGPEKTVFTMHKGLLCAVSSYFKAALEGDFKEAQEQTIELSEDDPQAMKYFQLWLYTQEILDEGENVSSMDWRLLIGLYLLGEVRMIHKLQNEVIDLIIRKNPQETGFPLQVMYEIYDKTCPMSPLRRIVVDMSARLGDLDEWSWDFADGGERAQRDFLKDLVLALYKDRGKRQVRNVWKVRCDYHVHAEGEPRCSEDVRNPDGRGLLGF